MLQDHLGFLTLNTKIRHGVFIPKYYNPEILERLNKLRQTHYLVDIERLISNKELSVLAGNEIGKMAYGTGEIPFVRTSDISNWEIKTDPKQGVGQEIYNKFSARQGVKQGDIFFVRDGTYLIGQSCMIMRSDLPCLFQSHILRFRVPDQAQINRYLFLALMNTPIAKAQIRSRQFTADIIDTVGNRYNEIILTVPKEPKTQKEITADIQRVVEGRAELREVIRRIPFWAQGLTKDADEPIPEMEEKMDDLHGNPGFLLKYQSAQGPIFIPKYYNPDIETALSNLEKTHELVVLADLIKQRVVSWKTGVEIGKMAYGTGPIPFIRTSDIANWELKADPKQSVSEDIYDQYQKKLDVQSQDIFVVRDGTYLVGTSCIVNKHDTKLLYCGGMYKLRVENKAELDPWMMLALLNAPIVRRQMRAKQFTRDIIDTLGKRLFEIVIPIPKDRKLREQIASRTRETMDNRVRLRNEIRQICLKAEGFDSISTYGEESINTAIG